VEDEKGFTFNELAFWLFLFTAVNYEKTTQIP
jgi:hypothetical protein